MRHGETEENVTKSSPTKLIQSEKESYKDVLVHSQSTHSDVDTVLNEIGLQQSRLVAKALKDTPFTHAYCSPLKRASQVLRSRIQG